MPNRDMFQIAFTKPKMSANGGEAEVMLYGEIIENMPDEWKWDDEAKSASDFRKAIKEARDSGASKLRLRINSPGGYVTEAVAMRTILANAGFDEVNICIEGLCASAATIVATLPGAHVSIAPGSEYMIHNPWCMVVGNADDLDHAAEHLRMEEDNSVKFYEKRSGQDEETIRQWMKDETWFSAEEAVRQGFCDEVTEEDAGSEESGAYVTGRTMAVMKAMYTKIPACLRVTQEKAAQTVSHEPLTVAAGGDAEINSKENRDMDIKDITLEQLRRENPGLVNEIMQSAAAEERTRMQDIDDLTPAGYEEMAAQAKASGTSSLDYHKQIIKAQREKSAAYLQSRRDETKQAANVTAAAAEDNTMSEDDELKAFASEMKALAAGTVAGTADNGMY